MGGEIPRDNQPDRTKEKLREPAKEREGRQTDAVAAERAVMSGATARLDAASRVKLPETATEQTLPLEQQLSIILRLGKRAYSEAPSEKKRELWKAYIDCVDKFREAYGGLPPIDKAWSSYKMQIGDAMNQANSTWLLRIFAQEKREYAKPRKLWERIKRIPGVNFVAGIFGGAAELGSGVITLANEGRKSLGVFASKEEQQKAAQVMGAVGESLKHFDEMAAGFIRSEEYAESIKEGGTTTGYVLGKHYFDLALILIGGGAAKEAVKRSGETAAASAREALKKATDAASNAAAAAARTAEPSGAREALTAAGAVGVRTLIAEEAGVSTTATRQGIRQAARAAGHAGKEVTKEGPKEAFKETAKRTTHIAEGSHGETPHGGA